VTTDRPHELRFVEEYYRDELQKRRSKLESAPPPLGRERDVARLLAEIDLALNRFADGTYGLCERCHEAIEPERLHADPLVRFCIDHLTPSEQRMLEQDLQLASRIQQELLPKSGRRFDGWEVEYHYEPAALVSGDCCDIVAGHDGDAYFLVGDVAGKGVAAAMLMSHLSALLRALVSQGLPLHQLMDRASRMFCESALTSHYATLVCIHARPTGELEMCNAGHPPPLLLRDDGVERLGATDLPIGMFCGSGFSSTAIRLASNDLLLMYSDGLVEMENPAGEDYGIDRLSAVAVTARRPKALVDALVRDIARYRVGRAMADDLTILAIGRSTPGNCEATN
jgi:sigma-B regulation protein RsbU (phosphoserine phosphatase)